MKILHTADWHLGDRLNHIDRTADLRRAVERVAEYCLGRDVEVLLVAGDLFSERCRADHLRDAIAELGRVFEPLFQRGGSVVAITGNHDNETFCRTLCHAMSLASPAVGTSGSLVPAGRFYLAAGPTFFRLRDRAGLQVQFVLMPYPTEYRYLQGAAQKYDNLEEKHRALHDAYTRTLREICESPAFDKTLPSVLAAHVYVKGSVMSNLFRLSEQEDIVFTGSDLHTGWAYVALGHIHRAQAVAGQQHMRYSGSIERLDMGERLDAKSVTLVDIGEEGLAGEPELLPLDATPFHDIVLADPGQELPRLGEDIPDAQTALVRCRVDYRRGSDDTGAILRELRRLFPRCYQIDWQDLSSPAALDGAALLGQSLRETVFEYLRLQLADRDELAEVLKLADQLVVQLEHEKDQ